MAFTKVAKPDTTPTKQARPKGASRAGLFDVGVFGRARFDRSITDSYVKQAKPNVSFTKQAKP